MQDSERRLKFEEVNYQEYRELIEKLSLMFNCNSINLEQQRLFKLEADYTTYCYFEGDLAYFKEVYEILYSKLGLNPYCTGIPILIKRVDNVIIPLIPLEKFLRNCKNIIRLKGKIAEKFTYGKEINLDKENIADSLSTNKINKSKSLYLVYDEGDIFLGFATIKNLDKNKVKIIPVRDIGWYLRKGG